MLRECTQSRFRALPDLARKASDSRQTRQPERDRSPRRSNPTPQPLESNARRRLSFPQRLIDQRLQLGLNPPVLRGRLHHENREHVVLRIDKEKGATGAVPAKFAFRQQCIWRLRGSHGKAKAKAAVGAWKVEMVAGDFCLRPDMI